MSNDKYTPIEYKIDTNIKNKFNKRIRTLKRFLLIFIIISIFSLFVNFLLLRYDNSETLNDKIKKQSIEINNHKKQSQKMEATIDSLMIIINKNGKQINDLEKQISKKDSLLNQYHTD